MFQNFKFDLTSFFIGVAAGLLIWFLTTRLQRVLPQARAALQAYLKRIQAARSGGAAAYLRQTADRKAQKAHLAAPLFALDEILVEPRFLAEAASDLNAPAEPGDSFLAKIYPQLPNWPELPSQYNWPSLSTDEILQNGANIAIIGQPGSGKSVALASLASKFARRAPTLGPLADHTPLYLHIYELGKIEKGISIFSAAVELFTLHAPLYVKSRVASYLTAQARAGTAVVLLDGLDQLDASSLANVAQSIAEDLQAYPGLRFVVTASPDSLDGLLKTGFQPLALAAWNIDERTAFARQWSERWTAQITPQIKKQNPNYDADPLFAMSWIPFDQTSLTPLDWTLKLWAFYSGDGRGPSTCGAFEAYISRTISKTLPVETLASLALAAMRSENEILSDAWLEKFFSDQSAQAGPDLAQMRAEAQQPPAKDQKPEKSLPAAARIVPQLVSAGILRPAGDNAYLFAHPLLMAYLASQAFDETSEIGFEHSCPADDWLLHFLAARNKGGMALEALIGRSQPPYYDDLQRVCHWLKDCPAGSDWRSQLMRQVVRLITQKELAPGLRPALFAALTVSNDPAVAALLRQLFTSPHDEVRTLAALAAGAIQDSKSVHELALLLEDRQPQVRLAACLALGVTRSSAALPYLSHLLAGGDETLGQAAAEALAGWGEEGQGLLKEGSNSENLSQRRSVVYGLSCIRQLWAHQLLESMAVQDGQWVVRNSAAQALETLNLPNRFVPGKLLPAADAPWLISFAARQGTLLPVEKIPFDALFSALETGSPEEKSNALTYLRVNPSADSIQKISHLAQTEASGLKSEAILALWYLKAGGGNLSAN